MARVSIRDLQAKIARARKRRRDNPGPVGRTIRQRALRVIRRARAAIVSERKRRANRVAAGPPRTHATLLSAKRWGHRPPINPKIIVLHSTESAPGSGRAVSNYLARGDIQADSHLVIDTDGTTYRLVPDGRKAWTQANFNSISLSIEQVGRAAQGAWPDQQLRATARWIAYWSKRYGIPITHSKSHGVALHSDLGQAGGGHHDPGANYPLALVLRYARSYRGT